MSNVTIFKDPNAVATTVTRGTTALGQSLAAPSITRRIQTNTNGTFKRIVGGEQIGKAVPHQLDVIVVDLLTDPSGSRRFICIEVTGPIQTNVTINYRQLYAQAMHDIMKGERYWLDDTDEAIVKEYNREFERVDPLEELFLFTDW